MRTALTTTFSMVLTSVPNWAWACAVCGSQDEKAAGAYLTMTIFLSLLPLSLIGGTGYWLWRRSKALDSKYESQNGDRNPDWKDTVLAPSSANEAIAVQNQDARHTP